MEQISPSRWPAVSVENDRLHLAPELLDACRSVSLRLGGPRLITVGVTSAIRGEGRSTIALALSLIQATDYQRRVVLLEIDLEKPSLAERLALAAHPGLAELARGLHSLGDVLQPAGPNLSVITAGNAVPDSSATILERLSSGLLQEIRAQADVVVADLPPVLGSSYGSRAATICEQAVLVVRAGVTPLPFVREAIDDLSAKPFLLLNGVHSSIPRWMRTVLGV